MLSVAQIGQFREQGFLRLPGIVPPGLMARLHALFDELLVPKPNMERLVIPSPAGPVVSNIHHLCHKGNLAALELLALPELLEAASQVCGDGVFLVQEFAVIKHRGDGNPVLWHQDMAHGRSGPSLTMGIYLDDADPGEGALRVVPGSHIDGRPIGELAREPSLEVPVKAGDILLHDMMLAHSSEPMPGNAIRRVIYFEFVSRKLAEMEKIYPPRVVDTRTRLLFAAQRHRRALDPAASQFQLSAQHPSPDDENRDLADVLAEIYAMKIQMRPASYCFERIPVRDIAA